MIKNGGLKIMSFLIAIGLFFFVRSENNSSVIGFTVPVEIKNLAKQKMLLSPLTPQARITVRGPSHLVSRVATGAYTFKVAIPPGNHHSFSAVLEENDIGLPPGVEVVAIEPSEIQFIVDEKVSKKIPVSIKIVGQVARHLKESISVQPKVVDVTGPYTLVSDLLDIKTEPLDVRDISKDTTLPIELILPKGPIKVTPSSVNILVKVEEINAKRKFVKLPVEIRSLVGAPYGIKPTVVDVEVGGGIEQVEALKNADIKPYVRIDSNMKPGSKVSVAVDTDKVGIKIVGVVPAQAEVILGQRR